jgi:thymidine kinase
MESILGTNPILQHQLKGVFNMPGYLELAFGPMFSGKTTWLTNLHKQCAYCNMRVVVVNYVGDTRYAAAADALLSTHDRTMIPCIMCSTIEELETLYASEVSDADVLLINEGQFFSDITRILRQVDAGKRVYICGLDGDFEKKRIGAFLDLIPHCDKVCKLTSLCSICRNGKEAIFSFRTTEETDQIVIGSDNYIPLCRACYQTETDKKYNKTT